MPAIRGRLTGLINDENLDKSIAIAIDRKTFFDNNAPLPDKPANPHNLALDPLSIAFARLMGFSWVAVAALAATDNEGITLEFNGTVKGNDVFNLPDGHPCAEGRSFYDAPGSTITGGTPDLIGCGNQNAYFALSTDVMWETRRDWPNGDGPYVDKGTLSLTRPMPATTVAGMASRAQEGRLRLSDVLKMDGLGIDPLIDDVWDGHWTTFQFRFPSGGGDYSVLPQEETDQCQP